MHPKWFLGFLLFKKNYVICLFYVKIRKAYRQIYVDKRELRPPSVWTHIRIVRYGFQLQLPISFICLMNHLKLILLLQNFFVGILKYFFLQSYF